MRTLTLRKLANRSAGEREPVLDQEDKPVVDADGRQVLKPWPLAGIKLEGRAPERFELPDDYVHRNLVEGWIELGGGKITIHTVDGDLVYRVLRGPGYSCCHCGTELLDEAHSKAHVGTHKGDSPDPENPAGYRRTHFYDVELEQAPKVTPPAPRKRRA